MEKANAQKPPEAVNKIRDDNHGQVVLVLQGGGALGAYQGGGAAGNLAVPARVVVSVHG
jgi:predicted acylesterase/phospholipase RssA